MVRLGQGKAVNYLKTLAKTTSPSAGQTARPEMLAPEH
jgi:hypothetical protein